MGFCWGCGIALNGCDNSEIYCTECGKMHAEKIEKVKAQSRRAKIELMIEKSIETIRKDKMRQDDMSTYEKDVKIIAKNARENPSMFESSQEMTAAIVLYHLKKHFRVQVKVGRKRVDITLPEEKIIIEIDGSRHDNREYHDTVRDIEILQRVGFDWQISHIPARFIDETPTRIYAKAYSIADAKRKYKESHGYDIAPEINAAMTARSRMRYCDYTKN